MTIAADANGHPVDQAAIDAANASVAEAAAQQALVTTSQTHSVLIVAGIAGAVWAWHKYRLGKIV